MKKIDPILFGLPSKTQILELKRGHFAILKNRKSRIVMKDGMVFLRLVERIWQKYPTAKISIISNAPVCSKTVAFLYEKGIEFIEK